MSQLSSSFRVARAALKHPPMTWQSRAQSSSLLWLDAGISNASHRLKSSARVPLCTAKSSTFGGSVGRVHLMSNPAPLQYYETIYHWRPFLLTMQSMMSTSTSGGSNFVAKEQNATESDQGSDIIIPFQRSKKNGSKAQKSGLDDRAQAKLTALSDAKKEAEEAKASFLSSVYKSGEEINREELHAKWNQAEQDLAHAYSQAIKYTSRITKNEKATREAEWLLYEWMDRFMDPFGGSSVWMKEDTDSSEVPNTMSLNKKWMIRTIHTIIPTLTREESKPPSGANESSSLPQIRIPPPESKDYLNLLRAYSMSKARRKGLQCEALMRNMMRLASTVANHYDENNEEWTKDKVHDVGMESVLSWEGNETKKWRLWVNDSIPNSKVFALATKCHAGTTHSDAFDRVILLNEIHDSFSDMCQSHIPGIYKDDPYVLYHSIKALKNLQKKEQRDKGKEWLGKLHKFVTSSENKDYLQEKEDADTVGVAEDQAEELEGDGKSLPQETPSTSYPTIDVTSAYMTIMRLTARLRGSKGAAADAWKVLDQMHCVRDIFQNGLENSELASTDDASDGENNEKLASKRAIANMHIRPNAYNLLLGLYRDSKSSDDATKAVELLQKMVDAGKKSFEERAGVPLPTEQSFEFTIMSLANMSDGEKALEEAERLIQLMQDQEYLESSVAAYNAYIICCNRQLHGKKELFDKALEILGKMNELGKTNPGVLPNPETLALVMKSCSLSENDDHDKVIDTASDLFFQLKEQEPDEKSAVALSDRAFYNIMKCVDNHLVEDADKKKELIEEFFSEACQRGLCSANVLTLFRNSVSEEDFKLTVGSGRLADHWIANIRGPRALYTDGSVGGAGKNARRKGKSTSNWKKKEKAKEFTRERKRNDKKAKKYFKKMKAA